MNGLLYPQPQGSLMDPRAAMLTQMGLGLMAGSGPSRTPVSFGQTVGQAGMQGMQAGQQALQAQQQEAFRQAQMKKMDEQLALERDRLNKEKTPQPRTQADSQGILRWVDGPQAGQAVAGFNTPKAPEGFRVGPTGALEPIKEYWDQKAAVAAAGKPSTTIENYPNPIPVMGTDGKPQMVQFGKHGEMRPTPFTPYKEPTQPADVERTAGGYASRMLQAEKITQEVGPIGNRTIGTDAAARVPVIGAYAERESMTPDQQRVRQAQEDWVRSKLRKESGAVIAKEEMDKEIELYFPQPGDKPEVITQKTASRETAIQAMMQSAGRAAPKREDMKVIPKSKQFSLDDGKSVIGILEPKTGKYYVVRGGKKFYIEE